MNILCVDQFPNWGGGQRSLVDLLPAFSARGWHPRVAVPGDGPFPRDIRRSGYETINFFSRTYTSTRKPPGQLFRYAKDFSHLARTFNQTRKSHNVDLFYVNGARFLPPVAWVAAQSGVPLIFHCHSRLAQRSAIFTTGASLHYCGGHVIGCCRHAVEPIRSYIPANRLQVLYNGVGLLNDPLTIRQHGRPLRRIGVIGRIEPEKGQLNFVLAVRLIQQRFPECEFLVVGSPMFSSARYYHRVLEAARGAPIQFMGWQENISEILSSMDILVVPSSPSEATTRVIPEAYAAQVPVVAYRCGGIPEVLQDGETGFLADEYTPECLAQRIVSVLQMCPERVRLVVSRARKAWEQNYTLDTYRELVCGMITRIASGCVPAK
jgi:glycosyltransferase involved in cell wall biosynthesis